MQINAPYGVFLLNITNGTGNITVTEPGRYSYVVLARTPEKWYVSNETYMFGPAEGSIVVGESQFTLPFYEFALLLAGIAPFAMAYYVFKWVFKKDEEDRYI